MTSLEKLIGLPGYQITGIEEGPEMFRISVHHQGAPACPECGRGLRQKDKRKRQPRHDSWGQRHCIPELETFKYLCRDCGRTF